jgi:hypothetical protein
MDRMGVAAALDVGCTRCNVTAAGERVRATRPAAVADPPGSWGAVVASSSR